MRATVHVEEPHLAARIRPLVLLVARQPSSFARLKARVRLPEPEAFLRAALGYLLTLPVVHRELLHWGERAEAIPSSKLRCAAERALSKRGNVEGAALFAILAPPAQRLRVIRALVSFQTAYNYLDVLSEAPGGNPSHKADRLHQALLSALQPDGEHADYYASSPDRNDGGYLEDIVDCCRTALRELPGWPDTAASIRAAATRILEFQVLNLAEADGGHAAMEAWAKRTTEPGSGLAWWETAAASGSSLAVHALIAAAADSELERHEIRAIDRAYFPWLGALHSLLDSLVDRQEDHEDGRGCLLDYYPSSSQAAVRLAGLAHQATGAVEDLPHAASHRVILAAMCSYYLSDPQCRTDEGRVIHDALADALGPTLGVTIALFAAKRFLHAVTDRSFAWR